MNPTPVETNQPSKQRNLATIIALCVFLVLIGIAVYVFLFNNNQATPSPTGSSTGTLPTTDGATTGSSTGTSGNTTGEPLPPIEIPTGNTISVKTREGGELVLDNFYKRAAEVKPYSDAVIVKNEDYVIWYFIRDSAFLVSILGEKDPNLNRALAESDFTAALKITQEQACQLKVVLAVSKEHPDLAGQDYGLSFCPWGREF